eukprot:3874413-Rhodomonas_salina.1
MLLRAAAHDPRHHARALWQRRKHPRAVSLPPLLPQLRKLRPCTLSRSECNCKVFNGAEATSENRVR